MFSLSSFGDRCYEQPPAGSPIWVCHSWGCRVVANGGLDDWLRVMSSCDLSGGHISANKYYRQTYRWSSLNHCADIALDDDCNLHTTCCIQLRYFVGLGLWTVYCSPKNLWTSDSTQLSAPALWYRPPEPFRWSCYVSKSTSLFYVTKTWTSRR
jgi:hypothetical protein